MKYNPGNGFKNEAFKIFEGIFVMGKLPTEGKITYTDKGDVYYGVHLDFEK